MPQLKKYIRRILGGSTDFEFRALKSASAVELVSYGRNGRAQRSHSSGRAESRSRSRKTLRPSYYSHHDHLSMLKQPDSSIQIANHSKSSMDNVEIAFIHIESTGFGDRTQLSHIPEEHCDDVSIKAEACKLDTPMPSIPLSLGPDGLLQSALATCHLLRQQPDFIEGVLLKAIDYKSTFPYLHYAIFNASARCNVPSVSSSQLSRLTKTATNGHKAKFLPGAYDELYSIIRKTTPLESRLPSSRFTAFIVISYKLLPGDNGSRGSLEESWLNWTGAREIYKYCPREWNLKRITLHRCTTGDAPPGMKVHQSKDVPFQFVLLCEFSNLLSPKHFLDGCETIERLKARRTGLVGLYKVQWVYEKPISLQNRIKDFEKLDVKVDQLDLKVDQLNLKTVELNTTKLDELEIKRDELAVKWDELKLGKVDTKSLNKTQHIMIPVTDASNPM